MIGNDIVDLKQAAKDSNWQRPRFFDKVFTEKEQEYISTSSNQHQMVWLLWSMKEAAYKVNVQQLGKRFFNPKRMECELISLKKGIVSIDNEIYFTTSKITEEYVYTVAKLDENIEVNSSIFRTENTSYKITSDTLKQSLLKSISETKGLAIQTLQIKKTEVGVPQIFNNSKQLLIALSLTHYGRFSGFAY
ncbi:4'-phosphopantetheinyl transferase superfamily protein [Olleya sp. YS]|uniref:4'-phosphopantetheinyl transferase family protein n=1 Tax=Olleya sp. YS TaxID=3028318 RepID=UPI0024344E9F|nr:4'-phosphopantetheinyl transferase superfamily protein [Olleya sp. YS]WGD35878.1 4'-phosphopantetheinyl transferase superfamily protein [Olleya sp. YS]